MSNENSVSLVAALGDYVASVMMQISDREARLYPVLGAEGNQFFIEVATGSVESRRILKTIRLEIQRGLDVLEPPLHAGEESTVTIPNESFLIALLGLFQTAMNANALILHPLNNRGDYLPGWNEAIIALSS